MNQNTSIFFDAPVKKNAKHYRLEARKRLSHGFGIFVLVTFLAFLLGGIGMQGFVSDIQTHLPVLFYGDANEMTEGIIEIIFSVVFVLFASAPATLGYRRFLLEAVDENLSEVRVPTLFRFFRSGTYFKSIRLHLLCAAMSLVIAAPALVCAVFADGMMPIIPKNTDIITYREAVAFLEETVPAFMKASAVLGLGTLISCFLLPIYYMYGFAHIIMADCPTAKPIEVLRASRNLMKGHKWQLFCLDFSFIGWYLLAAIFTCGIGLLFVTPYHYTARALFYHDIAQRGAAKDVEFPSIDPDEGDVADFPVKSASAPAESAEPAATPDGISAASLENIEFPSLDLDDDD
ncbi:MAG: DUF975 family protein [Clostridia bacterium]|nr:DUF975 family protein [Clostridia bacterium]